MSLRRSQKSVQNLTLLEHDAMSTLHTQIVCYSDTSAMLPESLCKPNSILDGKVSSTSKFAKKKGMYNKH